MDSFSVSNSISMKTAFESDEMTAAYLEELGTRETDAISNERIRKGDRILETYQVVSDAITGGMGSVWRVHHTGWDTDLAMKRPQPKFFAEGGRARKKQFVEECENWIRLGLHPNIVSCYYVREIGGVPTIFSEWMDNGSLSDRIKDGSLYSGSEEEIRERILSVAIQAAEGLKYSHENNLIHQDMKPGNLLLENGWNAKVADFGLASAHSGSGNSPGAAKTGGYTPAYCPAEQAAGEEPARWMDVYAWALTVLEMYAGRRFWTTGAEAKEHFAEYAGQCARPVPDEMVSLLGSCLTGRPDSFEPILARLKSIYRSETGSDYPDVDYTAISDSAGNLNNRALSFLDLNQADNAEKYWDAALEENPDHTESVINSILFKWRYDRYGVGRQVDRQAISDLKRNNHNDLYSVTVLLHASLLTGSREDALAYLESLEGLGADPGECEKYRALIDEKCREPEKILHFGKGEVPLAASCAGDIAVLAEQGDSVRLVSIQSEKAGEDAVRLDHNSKISFAVFNEAGNLLALCGPSGITVYDTESGSMLFRHTGMNVVYAVFDGEKKQIAAVLGDEEGELQEGILYRLEDGEEIRRLKARPASELRGRVIQHLWEEDGELFVTAPDNTCTVDCSLDANGETQYLFRPCRNRDGNSCRIVYRDRATGSPLLTENVSGQRPLGTGLVSEKSGDSCDVLRIRVPDLAMFPHMELSRIHSVREQIREKEEYQVYIREAEQLLGEKKYAEALERIDAVLAMNRYEHDSRALELRGEINASLKNKIFLKCLELKDFSEPLPSATPGTFPEAPAEIFRAASNCLTIEDAGQDFSGNLMASIWTKAMASNDFPIEKVYCTSDEHTFACVGWHHEHRQVGHTPDFDPIIQDSTEYRISLYNDEEDKLKAFPAFSSASMRELYLDRSFPYHMSVAYSREYQRLVAGNPDYDTPRVTWDTETQSQVAEENVMTYAILLLSSSRYYLAVSETTLYIVDLADNAIVWTEPVKAGKAVKYHGEVQFDRERDIYRIEMEDGSWLCGQVLWTYDTEAAEPPEQPRKKPAQKGKSTVDATLYVDDTKNFVIEDGVLTEYTGKKTQVIIPDTVTGIGDGVFSGNEQIESVTIPEGVRSIGDSVFEGCTALADITIPESVESIGDSAFAGCESLRTAVLPDRATDLGDGLFAGCSVLSSVKLPEGLEEIPDRMFEDCPRLGGMRIPEDAERIGKGAFRNCRGIGRIIIPDNVSVIDDGAFEGCTNMDAVEEMSVCLDIIGEDAFRSCRCLDWIRLESVDEIRARAFRDCTALKEIEIPGSVDLIGEEAFSGCRRLEDITIPKSVKSIGKHAFASVREGFVISGEAGSEAERYAKSENIPFKDISAPEKPAAPTPPQPAPRPEPKKTSEAPALRPAVPRQEEKKKGFFSRLFGKK